MSKNKARRRPSASRPVNDSQIIDQPSAGNGLGLSLVSRMTMDEIINQYARLGGKQNLLGNNTYAANRITQQYQLLNSLYRGDWLAGKIVDTIPEDMVKNWYKLTCQVEPDQISILQNIERRTHLKTQILEGLRLGRLYGGAAGIIMIDGQEDMLETPLNMNTIMPGSFKGLIIADRWNGVYPSSSQVTDRSDPDYGLPEYYKFLMDETNTDYGISVHHSRVVRFTGRWLPYLERVIELQWGMSELEHVYDELNKRNSTSANIAQLVFQAHLRVLKMDKFGQALAFMDQRSQQALYRTLEAQNKLMNNMSLQIMSKDDEFQTFQYTFSGLSDVYEQFMMDVAGAAEIPVTKLFGRSPAGMNATGESDLTNYYDTVKKWQEAQLRPILDKLLPILCLSAWGAIPDDLDFDFNPVRDISDSERSNLIKQSADAINSVFQSGIISQKIALKELRESGKPLDMWTNITDEDIDNADDSMNPQEQEPGLEELPVDPGNEEGQLRQMEGDIPPGAGAENPTKAADAAPNRLLVLLRRLLGREKAQDFNENHDPGSGRFTAGGGSSNSGSSGGGAFKSESEVKSYLSGKPKANRKEIDKHVQGTPEYEKYRSQREQSGKPPQSHFDPKDLDAVEEEILQALKEGRCEILKKRDGSFRAYLRIASAKGTAYNKQGVELQSSFVEVMISKKKGIHYYAKPEGDDES